MPGIRLFTGNRLEDLIMELFDVISIPLSSPMQEETIIVQSKGMERWISMQTASYFGIQANISFPFPNSIINSIYKNILDCSEKDSIYRPDFLAWCIMDILPKLFNNPLFENIKNYANDNPLENSNMLPDYKNLKLYQLSSLIADTFDQYLFYRPDLIFSWEKNDLRSTPDSERWQAVLWQKIVYSDTKSEFFHRAELRMRLLKKLYRGRPDLSLIPERISIFGISVLPPFHLEIFKALANHIDVNFFLLNPCREFWSYISSEREIASKKNNQEELFDTFHFERGNKLLSSLGLMGREFYSCFYDMGFDEISGFIKTDNFKDNKKDSILHIIQSDILNLTDRKKTGKYELKNIDNSIRIHNCHSPLREVEVLHDQLLNILDNNKSFKQEDILVMIPDIDTYVPYIESVFSYKGNALSYNISDRKLLLESRTVGTFFHILNLSDLRFSVNSILKLLEVPSITDKFGFNSEDILLIKKWIKQLNIKWGFSDSSKKELGLPEQKENTWNEGIRRLLLGYSMSTENIFMDILPYAEFELSKSGLLSSFIKFINILADITDSLKTPYTLTGWIKILVRIINDIFKPQKNNEKELSLLTNTILSLEKIEKISGFSNKIYLNTLVQFLKSRLSMKNMSFSFLSGGITFCAMLPMRSIPFKIICLLGMNNNSFPGRNTKISFDLISNFPKQGDRSRRNDDRYLFLETILSARDILYISYTGQSIEDNTESEPSVLISELKDTINESFKYNNKESIIPLISVKHKLQAFNTDYFSVEKDFFSYSEENFKACIKSQEQKNSNLFTINIPPADNKFIDIASLFRFFKNPSKFLLNNRFNIYLEKPKSYFSDKENLNFNELDKYRLTNEILLKIESGEDITDYYKVIKAKGELPHGKKGKIIYNELFENVCRFYKEISVYSGHQSMLKIDIMINKVNLTGNISISGNRDLQLIYRYAGTKPYDIIKLWIYHLAACVYLQQSDNPIKSSFKSIFFSNTEKIELDYIKNAYEILKMLIDFYNKGSSAVFNFFPGASYYFSEILYKKNQDKNEIKNQSDEIELAILKIFKIWDGYGHGEKDDPYFKYFFSDIEPFNTDFINNSLDIYYPVFNSMNKYSLNIII